MGPAGIARCVMPAVFYEERGVIGICSGPQAAEYLQGLTSFDLRGLTFGKSAFVPLEGFNLHVARGGYTGEDGFEVRSAPPALYTHRDAHQKG